MLREIGKMNGSFFEQRVARCADHVQGVFFEGFDLEAFSGGGEGDEANIGFACRDRLIHLVGTAVIHLNFDLRESP